MQLHGLPLSGTLPSSFHSRLKELQLDHTSLSGTINAAFWERRWRVRRHAAGQHGKVLNHELAICYASAAAANARAAVCGILCARVPSLTGSG